MSEPVGWERPGAASTRESAHGTLQSVEGILQTATRLSLLYIVYKAATSLSAFWRDQQEESARIERNRARARKNLVDTQHRQDEQDTTEIHQGIRNSFLNRERNKVRFRPQSVRGHWEGNVFIPQEAQPTQGRKPSR